MITAKSIDKLTQRWQRKGPADTVLAVIETLLSPLIRRRRRFVFDARMDVPRQPSEWAEDETLLVIGPEDLHGLDRVLLSALQIERHRRDFECISRGNRLFLVTAGTDCLHRSYIRLIEGEASDRRSMFFGELGALPEIRSCETAEQARGKGLYRRVLNEQLQYLKLLGYKRAVLYIVAGNTPSIKGVTAAGFRVCRTLHDWILFNLFVFQRVHESGGSRWRVFLR